MPYPEPLSKIEALPPTRPTTFAASHEPVARVAGCTRCGYNLFGLPRDGHCPECGRSVRTSLGAWSSRVSHAHLGDLLAGTIWLLVATLLSPLCIVLSFACLGAFGASPRVAGGLAANCFVATLFVSIKADLRLAEFARRYALGDESPLDLFTAAAGIGLIFLTLQAFLVMMDGGFDADGHIIPATIGFGLLTLGAGRFVGFYRRFEQLERLREYHHTGRGPTRSSFGVWKTISDGLLVGCVFVMLLVFALSDGAAETFGAVLILAALVSLLALIFYAATWCVVVVNHTGLLLGVIRLRRRTPAEGS